MKTALLLQPKTWRMTTDAYEKLVTSGDLEGQHVELIDGKIIQMPPQTEPHGVGVMLAQSALVAAFGEGYTIRPQLPLSLGEYSRSEPDIAVVPGSKRDSLKGGTPTTALLVVEISFATLAFDRTRKLSLYARFGIPEYWIINLVERQLEVHRHPTRDPEHKLRFRYSERMVLKTKDSVSPLAAVKARVRVRDLLP